MDDMEELDREWEKLTLKQQKFVLHYIQTGDAVESFLEAGYKKPVSNRLHQVAYRLKCNPKVRKQIQARIRAMQGPEIAKGEEVMKYLTAVMRGEVKDAFGLDTTVSERTRAAIELAKRTFDIDAKVKDDKEVTIKLSWEPDDKADKKSE